MPKSASSNAPTLPAAEGLTFEQLRVLQVLARMTELARMSDDTARLFVDVMEPMLDQLADNDVFGRNRQQDPRGDGRRGTWTMSNVQGVDT